jgi:hypothetical protein
MRRKLKLPKFIAEFELRNYIFPLSATVFGLGIFSLYLSIIGCFVRPGLRPATIVPRVISDLIDQIGHWNMWLLLIGVLLVLFGGGYLIDFLLKRRKFLKLIGTGSKAVFIRSQDDIEYLAWKLGRRYELKVINKKQELRIRT